MKTLRLFGAAWMVMAAIAAAAVPAASADDFTAEEYPVLLTGGKDGAFVDQFATTAGTAQCATPKYTATITGATTSATVTGTFFGCTTAGVPSTFSMNGCTFQFNLAGGGSTTADADLNCPAGSEVTITVAPASGTHPCTIHIKAQADIAGGALITNIGTAATREATANIELSGIDYSHTAGTGLAKCAAGSGTTGTLKMKTLLTGENHAGTKHIGIFLS